MEGGLRLIEDVKPSVGIFRSGTSHRKIRQTLLYCLIAFAFPLFLPFFHIGLFTYIWQDFNRVVDRKLCTCSCWDTVFKGTYETGLASYKHVYFNATLNTFKIWFYTIVSVLILYESVKYLSRLLFTKKANFWMLILFAASVYPHYYSWWSYFNYLNDDFYSQWYHQTYFTMTEMSSTFCVLFLADQARSNNILALLVIFVVAVTHILISGFDQLVSNVLFGDGGLHQVLRDVFMFLPDLLHLAVAIKEMRRVARCKRTPATHLISNRQFLVSLVFVATSWLICYTI